MILYNLYYIQNVIMYKTKASAIYFFIVIIMYFDITIPFNNFVTKEWYEWTAKVITRNEIKTKCRGTNYESKFIEWSLTLNQ